MSLSFKRSGYCVLGQVMVILALNLPTDFHICYPSTHTDANPLTHIYSPVHPRVGISICYFYMLFLYAISICYFYMLFLYAISTCYSTKRVPNTVTLYKYLYRVDTCHFVGKAELYKYCPLAVSQRLWIYVTYLFTWFLDTCQRLCQ